MSDVKSIDLGVAFVTDFEELWLLKGKHFFKNKNKKKTESRGLGLQFGWLFSHTTCTVEDTISQRKNKTEEYEKKTSQTVHTHQHSPINIMITEINDF